MTITTEMPIEGISAMESNLTNNDLGFVVRRLPKDVRDLLSKFQGTLFLGGGFIRAVVAGEEPNDIDLFGTSPDHIKKIADELQESRGGEKNCRLHRTKNAITVISIGRITVQFITRWTFSTPEDVFKSFDFTVCQAAIYRDGAGKQSPWRSKVSPAFYIDLAAKRLVYTSPKREEEAGGSMLRVLKYVRRGYVIQVDSLALVIARLTAAVRSADVDVSDENATGWVINGLLQEVDPSIAVDGLDVVDDHESKIDGIDAAQMEWDEQ